jgi:hypothetical protein
MLMQSYGHTGRWSDAVEMGERAYRGAAWNALVAGALAGMLVRSGQHDRAAEIMRTIGNPPRPIFGRVEYHLWTGEIDAAADWYARAIAERDPFCVIFANGPHGRVLRASPRWAPLAQAMNLA